MSEENSSYEAFLSGTEGAPAGNLLNSAQILNAVEDIGQRPHSLQNKWGAASTCDTDGGVSPGEGNRGESLSGRVHAVPVDATCSGNKRPTNGILRTILLGRSASSGFHGYVMKVPVIWFDDLFLHLRHH